MVPDFCQFAWRLGGGWMGTLKNYWSTVIASMGGTLIFGLWWPRKAFQRCITSSHPLLRVDIIGGYFCSIAIDGLGESHPGQRYRIQQSAFVSWLTAATAAYLLIWRKPAETQLAKQLCFHFYDDSYIMTFSLENDRFIEIESPKLCDPLL
jgi:hypothetical protein